jgi:hypothetical protein
MAQGGMAHPSPDDPKPAHIPHPKELSSQRTVILKSSVILSTAKNLRLSLHL